MTRQATLEARGAGKRGTAVENAIDADLDDFTPDSHTGGYTSPLMARMSSDGRLTLEMLRTFVPIFHAGERAAIRLIETPDMDRDERDDLSDLVRAGEDAKERLMIAGIPLVRHLAKKEHARRQNWQSQVTLDDLIQEGSHGFLRGLRAYKVEGAHKSATNYLGQWVLTDMRRNVETVDNDIAVAYDTAERFRKIRAIRSRLASTLGREPSDEEILDAATDPTFKGGAKIGRVNKTGKPPRRPLTQAHLDEERALRGRVGAVARFTDNAGDEDSPALTADQGHSIYAEEAVHEGDVDGVINDGVRVGLQKLLLETFNLMHLPTMQRDIISRRFGLAPHPSEQTAREIISATGLRREKVNGVLDAFTGEMTRPGGPFHQACGQWEPDDLVELGLGWVLTALGNWASVSAATRPSPVPAILTDPLVEQPAPAQPGLFDVIAAPAAIPAHQRIGQVKATFECEFHPNGFNGIYLTRRDVPARRACPQCQQPSPVTRVQAI